jgi:hypothetical protein
VGGRAVIAVGVKAERSIGTKLGDRPSAQIFGSKRAEERLCRCQQTPSRLRRSGRRLWRSRISGHLGRRRQAQESTRLIQRLAKPRMAAARGDDVEEIAMIAGRGIGPFSRRPTVSARAEPHIETSPGRVSNVANHPVMAFSAAVGEIAAAHSLGILPEASRYVGSWTAHAGLLQAALRSMTRWIGNRSTSASNTSAPAAPAGT